MIDWEEISKAECADDLKDVKLWLFQENVRLENERKELERTRDKFLNERVRFQKEMDELNRRTVLERKRLREESMFFDKKMAILQNGFRQLEDDRKAVNRQKEALERECVHSLSENAAGGTLPEDAARILFRGISNSLALRKRYKDLVKVFHPDNLFGDEELVQMINREYLRRRREE